MGITAVLQVLFAEARSGQYKKGERKGEDWAMNVCQCAVHDSEGRVQVGELALPKGMELPKPGFYDAEFRVGVGFDKKVAGYLVGLKPRAAAPAPAPAAVPAGARSAS